jgi:phage terminase large subunit GpA-like protein
VNAPLAHTLLAPPSDALAALIERVFAELRPLPPLSCAQWAETYRQLSKEETDDFPGPFEIDNAPATRGILELVGAKGVKRIVGQKSAQITWTGGVVCSVLGYHVHYRPCIQVAMFPREKSAKDFDAEKFAPMVRATPVLRERIRLKSRSDGNSSTRKHYPGGLIKFVASNSPSDAKSTTARVMIVEEPDDVNKDVKGQGNTITMLRERGKTVRNSFLLIGGTPSIKGVSQIEKEMRTTDQRRFMVACHHCNEAHEVEFEHVHIPGLHLSDEDLQRPDIDTEFPQRDVYGRARWEDAYYACPHCGGLWSDDERIDNIRRAARVAPNFGWEPTAQASDPGFYFNELQSVFDGSHVPILAEKYLRAKHLLDAGDATEMIVFENATRGRAWEYNQGDLPEEDALRERAEPYTEWSVPAMGALVPVMFADIQHDRIAVCVWVIGRGEEMWLAYWGEHWGKTVVPEAGAWLELEQLLDAKVRHPSGAELPLAAIAVDTGDGQTSDASYAFVRKHNKRDRQVLATKGASDSVGRVEIWTKPKAIDPNKRSTKAAKAGVHVHTIGAAKAKDLVLGWAAQAGRVRLTGNGPGRLHWYQGVRDDFFEQLLSEIKVPSRTRRNVREWKKRTDRNNECLDATVGCVWLSRHLRLHLRRAEQWAAIEQRINPGGAGAPTPRFAKPADLPASSHRSPVEPQRQTAPTTARLPPLQVGAGQGGRVSIAGHARFSSGPGGGSRGGR